MISHTDEDRLLHLFAPPHLCVKQYNKGVMCCIPGTWHNSSKVNITVEEFCQHRKTKSCPLLLKNCASNC